MSQFSHDCLQFINEQYQAIQPLPEFAQHPEHLLALYRHMALVRALDNKAIKLQRTGKMGTYPSSQGQEAVSVGIGAAMRRDDVFCPYYRDQGTLLWRGVSLAEILWYWGGDERGSHYANPDVQQDFPNCVPIAGQCLHAAGVAYAISYRQQARAVVTTLGEGGTSKGDFYEAMNFAGVFQLPLVFVVNNNQWAISVPRQQQTAAETIAQKAVATGFDGVQVDGNDVIAVQYAVQQACDKARLGQGPTLIEAVTYRLCDHTTADDAGRYRPHDEYKAAWQKEPIARLGYYLEGQGQWSRDKEQQLQLEINETLEAAVAKFQALPQAKPTAMFDHLYATLPEALHDQYDEVRGQR